MFNVCTLPHTKLGIEVRFYSSSTPYESHSSISRAPQSLSAKIISEALFGLFTSTEYNIVSQIAAYIPSDFDDDSSRRVAGSLSTSTSHGRISQWLNLVVPRSILTSIVVDIFVFKAGSQRQPGALQKIATPPSRRRTNLLAKLNIRRTR